MSDTSTDVLGRTYPFKPRTLPLAGRELHRDDGLPLIMGVLNVTPDSFSDGGKHLDPGRALRHVLAMVEEGVDIVDIGASSSRPGATPVSQEVEWRRLEPVLRAIQRECPIPVSLDTWNARTAELARAYGVALVNDISGGRQDPEMLRFVAAHDLPYCVMHMQGTPQTMQDEPYYANVVEEVFAFLRTQTASAIACGLRPERIIVDPGIGFGKTLDHNIKLMRALGHLRELGLVLVGLSRKSSLSAISRSNDKERAPESIAGAIAAALNGADILRVHDVTSTIRALRVARAFIPAT